MLSRHSKQGAYLDFYLIINSAEMNDAAVFPPFSEMLFAYGIVLIAVDTSSPKVTSVEHERSLPESANQGYAR
jgi:hypothetical protein